MGLNLVIHYQRKNHKDNNILIGKRLFLINTIIWHDKPNQLIKHFQTLIFQFYLFGMKILLLVLCAFCCQYYLCSSLSFVHPYSYINNWSRVISKWKLWFYGFIKKTSNFVISFFAQYTALYSSHVILKFFSRSSCSLFVL